MIKENIIKINMYILFQLQNQILNQASDIELSKYKVTFVFVSFFNSDITQVVEIIPHGCHYSDVIMGAMASQITSLTTVYATFHSGADQRKYQNSTSLAFVGGNSPVTGEFHAQRASNAEKVSIWWLHHVMRSKHYSCWRSRNAKSQRINRRGIDQFSRNMPVSAPEG